MNCKYMKQQITIVVSRMKNSCLKNDAGSRFMIVNACQTVLSYGSMSIKVSILYIDALYLLFIGINGSYVH